MKAPLQSARRIQSQTKKRTRVHAALIYRAHKEVTPAGMRTPDFLTSRPIFPRSVLLRLVSSEASRLSKTNRGKVITVREINTAVRQVQQKIQTRAAA